MSSVGIARRFVTVGYPRRGPPCRFTTSTRRIVSDDHDTTHHESVDDIKSPDSSVTPERFVPWSQYSQILCQVSRHENEITRINMQYQFLNGRFDSLDRKLETMTARSDRNIEKMDSEMNRRFETMGNEINRRFKAMDKKVTTWFLALMGIVVVKGGFDFFSDKNCTHK
ncbi:hypothetical protein DFP73DRAFT_562446 [Morchella snyderi]|nr:hypothetical protein DFP73DRAFT_562446 [Morchella snyderi]